MAKACSTPNRCLSSKTLGDVPFLAGDDQQIGARARWLNPFPRKRGAKRSADPTLSGEEGEQPPAFVRDAELDPALADKGRAQLFLQLQRLGADLACKKVILGQKHDRSGRCRKSPAFRSRKTSGRSECGCRSRFPAQGDGPAFERRFHPGSRWCGRTAPRRGGWRRTQGWLRPWGGAGTTIDEPIIIWMSDGHLPGKIPRRFCRFERCVEQAWPGCVR